MGSLFRACAGSELSFDLLPAAVCRAGRAVAARHACCALAGLAVRLILPFSLPLLKLLSLFLPPPPGCFCRRRGEIVAGGGSRGRFQGEGWFPPLLSLVLVLPLLLVLLFLEPNLQKAQARGRGGGWDIWGKEGGRVEEKGRTQGGREDDK